MSHLLSSSVKVKNCILQVCINMHPLAVKHLICISLQEISWGPEDGVPSNNVALAPDSTVSLSFQNCQKVEILTQTFNSVPLLQNVSIQNIEEFTIHSRIYESRIGSGQSATISNFKIVNVSVFKNNDK